MVELEHRYVRFPAVHTWVCLQISHDLLLVLTASDAGVPEEPRLLDFAIGSVVESVDLGEARPTPRLTLCLTVPHWRKLSERLGDPASRARLHSGT
jgi:hypothetical protein